MDQRAFKEKDVPTPGITEDSHGLGRGYSSPTWYIVFFRKNQTDWHSLSEREEHYGAFRIPS